MNIPYYLSLELKNSRHPLGVKFKEAQRKNNLVGDVKKYHIQRCEIFDLEIPLDEMQYGMGNSYKELINIID